MSYAAKYIVPFRTISEILCEIRFDVKGYTGVAKELIGGGDPIKIEVDTSDVLIPIRSSSATVSVYVLITYKTYIQAIRLELK